MAKDPLTRRQALKGLTALAGVAAGASAGCGGGRGGRDTRQLSPGSTLRVEFSPPQPLSGQEVTIKFITNVANPGDKIPSPGMPVCLTCNRPDLLPLPEMVTIVDSDHFALTRTIANFQGKDMESVGFVAEIKGKQKVPMTVRKVNGERARHRDEEAAAASLKAWLSWATRSRLEPFRRLAQTVRAKFDADVRGMMPDRNNAYVEAMNGLLQNVKRAARGFRTSDNFIATAGA